MGALDFFKALQKLDGAVSKAPCGSIVNRRVRKASTAREFCATDLGVKFRDLTNCV